MLFIHFVGDALGKGGIETGVASPHTFGIGEEFNTAGGVKLVGHIESKVVDKAVPVGPTLVIRWGGITLNNGRNERYFGDSRIIVVDEGIHGIRSERPLIIDRVIEQDFKHIKSIRSALRAVETWVGKLGVETKVCSTIF